MNIANYACQCRGSSHKNLPQDATANALGRKVGIVMTLVFAHETCRIPLPEMDPPEVEAKNKQTQNSINFPTKNIKYLS